MEGGKNGVPRIGYEAPLVYSAYEGAGIAD
jgi:hypothetical protein